MPTRSPFHNISRRFRRPFSAAFIPISGGGTGAFAAAREQGKKVMYTIPCAAAAWSFTPVAVEAIGAPGPSDQNFIRMRINRQSMRTGMLAGAMASAVWGRLGTVVAKGVATMLTCAYWCGAFHRAWPCAAVWAYCSLTNFHPTDHRSINGRWC